MQLYQNWERVLPCHLFRFSNSVSCLLLLRDLCKKGALLEEWQITYFHRFYSVLKTYCYPCKGLFSLAPLVLVPWNVKRSHFFLFSNYPRQKILADKVVVALTQTWNIKEKHPFKINGFETLIWLVLKSRRRITSVWFDGKSYQCSICWINWNQIHKTNT